MARKNRVTLWGKLLSDPMISTDAITLEPKKASFFMSVVNQERDTGLNEEDIIYSEPFVYTEDSKIIKTIMSTNWKKGDLVDVRGVVTTVDATRAAMCPHCNNKNSRPGEVTFITPLFVEKRYDGEGLDDKAADKIMREHREISNLVELSGSVCADPHEQRKAKIYGDIVSRMSYKGLAQFQMAVNRHFFIASDNPTTKTDYPHIVSIGENAEEDLVRLRKDSRITVEGMIVTRNFRKTHTCQFCGEKFDRDEKVTEILTYSTEYHANYNEIEGTGHEAKVNRDKLALQGAYDKLGIKSDDNNSEE